MPTNLSNLIGQAKADAKKIVTQNGERCGALIDANPLERERIHLVLIDDAKRGLADIAAGRTIEADTALAQLQQRRKTGSATPAGKRPIMRRG